MTKINFEIKRYNVKLYKYHYGNTDTLSDFFLFYFIFNNFFSFYFISYQFILFQFVLFNFFSLHFILFLFCRFEDAIEVLKAFERKDTQMKAMAATNLSFIYFLEGQREEMQIEDIYLHISIRQIPVRFTRFLHFKHIFIQSTSQMDA